MSAEIGVSKTAVYDKLNRLEPNVSQALVRYSAREMTTIIEQVGGQMPELLPGYRITTSAFPCVLRRRGVARQNSFLAMVWEPQNIVCLCCSTLELELCPGKSLVVLDPALALATDIFPCEDGHAQERSLLPEVLETVEASDLWIGDRNFCTTEFIFSIKSQQAFFLVRQHQNLPWTAL